MGLLAGIPSWAAALVAGAAVGFVAIALTGTVVAVMRHFRGR